MIFSRGLLAVNVGLGLLCASSFFSDASAESAPSFARVEVETPGELKLGKVLQARVAITLVAATPILEVTARATGSGLTLPLKQKWRFVKVPAGTTTTFNVPYQLTKKFKTGTVQFDISTLDKSGSKRLPAQKQTATLTLRR